MKHVLKLTFFVVIVAICLLLGTMKFLWSFKKDDIGSVGAWLDDKTGWLSWFDKWS